MWGGGGDTTHSWVCMYVCVGGVCGRWLLSPGCGLCCVGNRLESMNLLQHWRPASPPHFKDHTKPDILFISLETRCTLNICTVRVSYEASHQYLKLNTNKTFVVFKFFILFLHSHTRCAIKLVPYQKTRSSFVWAEMYTGALHSLELFRGLRVYVCVWSDSCAHQPLRCVHPPRLGARCVG